ncbi:phasin [Bradyrhizobium sp. SYSU BS000235]|uniref:phasin n=1 Tax=Bradyrhizobium sp. SYSU BS000235 TaxID=3411332 RepID=UPI003C77984C
MNDSALNVDVNGTQPNANLRTNGQGFDLSLFPLPGIFRGLAEQNVGRVRENCDKMKAASEEIADSLREAYASNAKGAADYGAKVIEISTVNTQSAFDFLNGLMATKSLSDIMNLSATQGRKNLEIASAQNRELWELAQRAAAETAEPIKKSFTKVLQPVS